MDMKLCFLSREAVEHEEGKDEIGTKFCVYARYTYRLPIRTEQTLLFERYCVKILVRAIQTEID